MLRLSSTTTIRTGWAVVMGKVVAAVDPTWSLSGKL